MSAALTDDDTALIGSPGPFTWRGTVFAVSVSQDFLFRDKTHYHTPLSEVEKFGYLGMSVAAGRFLPRAESCGQETSYAAGAPRANGVGAVVLFVKCAGGGEELRVQRVLRGDDFAGKVSCNIIY